MPAPQHQPETSEGAATDRPIVRTGRRALVLGAAAAVAAIAVEQQHAQAADGAALLIGSANAATNKTILVASAEIAFSAESQSVYGWGLNGKGSAYGVIGEANGYAGVFGDTSGGSSVGVSGLSRSVSGSGSGVSGGGSSPNSAGVRGQSPGIGVHGRTDTFGTLAAVPIGVRGDATPSSGLGGHFAGGRAAIRLEPRDTAGAPTADAHQIGDIVVDIGGRVFVCTVGGTPGTWNELGAPPPTPPAPPAPRPTLQLLPAPERFIDTRDGTGGVRGTAAAGTTRTFSLTGVNGLSGNPALRIPDTAIYVAGNLAAIGTDNASLSSFITLWPSGTRPSTSSINFGPARTAGAVSNSVLLNLADVPGGHRGFQIFNNAACDYVFDVSGYYVLA